MSRVTALLAMAAVAIFGPAAPVEARPLVTVAAGTLLGTDDGAVRSLKGIPYAASPIDNLHGVIAKAGYLLDRSFAKSTLEDLRGLSTFT